MGTETNTRRDFLKMAGLGLVTVAAAGTLARGAEGQDEKKVDKEFFIRPEELTLKFHHTGAQRRLSFANFGGTPQAWRKACRAKLAELIGFVKPTPRQARALDRTRRRPRRGLGDAGR